MSHNVSVSETKQLIRAFILGDAAVRAACAQVLTGHVSTADAQTLLQTSPILVISDLGGESGYFRAYESLPVELTLWSKRGSDEIGTIYDLVYDRLQSERVQVNGLDLVGLATESQRLVSGYDETTVAWWGRSRWVFRLV